jgi:hypothetical protein
VLILEEQGVHLPEPALRAGRLGRFGGAGGVRMDLAQREVPVRELQPWTEGLLHRLDDRIGRPAVGALEVAILHERRGRVGRTGDVVALGKRQGQARTMGAHRRPLLRLRPRGSPR